VAQRHKRKLSTAIPGERGPALEREGGPASSRGLVAARVRQ
jgi:hypothetical protein